MNNATKNILSKWWLPQDIAYNINNDSKALLYYKIQQSIKNFINIISGKNNITVVYNALNTSYSTKDTIVLDSKLILNNKFDVSVGLALHEASHILLSDYTYLAYNELNEYLHSNGIFMEYDDVHPIINIIEDRRVDAYIIYHNKGYIDYYKALYNEFMFTPSLKFLLQSYIDDIHTIQYDVAFFQLLLCQIITPEGEELCKALGSFGKEVYETFDVKNISRLKNTADSISLAVKLIKIFLKYKNTNFIKELPNNKANTSDKKDNTNNTNNNSKSNKKLLSNKQKYDDKINKDISKMRDFINQQLEKKFISKNDACKVDACTKTNIQLKQSQFDCNVQCYILHGFKTGVENLGIHCYTKDANRIQHNTSLIEKGILKGNQLRNKLLTRNECDIFTTKQLLSGILDSEMLYKASYSNTVFKKVTISTSQDINLHLSLDVSTSMMGEKFDKSFILLLALAIATKGIQNIHTSISLRATIGEYRQYPVLWMIYDSNNPNMSTLNYIHKNFIHIRPNGATPEGLCYEALSKIIIDNSKGKQSFLINFTDGLPFINMGDGIKYKGTKAEHHSYMQVKKLIDNNINIYSYFLYNEDEQTNHYEMDRNFRSFKNIYGTAKNCESIYADNPLNFMMLINKLNNFLEKKQK
jgi:hypothetical protein